MWRPMIHVPADCKEKGGYFCSDINGYTCIAEKSNREGFCDNPYLHCNLQSHV